MPNIADVASAYKLGWRDAVNDRLADVQHLLTRPMWDQVQKQIDKDASEAWDRVAPYFMNEDVG